MGNCCFSGYGGTATSAMLHKRSVWQRMRPAICVFLMSSFRVTQ